MAVKLEGPIRRYIGLSTDTKPTHDDDSTSRVALPAGSSFLETDTGRIYRFNGTEWGFPSEEDSVAILLTELILEVRQLRERIEMVTA